MMPQDLINITEIAERLRSDRKTIGGVIKAKRIRTHRDPRNPLSKGVTPEDYEVIKEALAPVAVGSN